MRPIRLLPSVMAALSAFVGSGAADVDPIVIKGSHFFYKTNGTEFFIKGIAYQASVTADDTTNGTDDYIDPLTDPAGCKRDIPLLKELDTNVVRVYAIKPDEDHSECMQMLADAGIYVIADLSQPSESINRETPQWNNALYARYTSVIDSLANYTNVLGFFAGNEVTNNASNTDASAFVKAAVRDMKSYIADKGYRKIGVGYAADDDADIRQQIREYFDCGTDAERIDFFGLNIYEWCGDSSFKESGYADRTKDFADYDIPAFFSEYGCNAVQPRQFTEVQALFGPEMTGVWSGGIVYMYFQEVNNYGLVTVEGSSVSKLPDFTSLSSQMAKATPSLTNMADYTPTNTKNAACPTVNASWQAVASPLPPTPNQDLCSCMTQSLSCKANSDLSAKDVGRLIGVVCGLSESACAGISTNATSGKYGAYSVCDPADQLSWVFNAYYLEQGKKDSACDFSGAATKQNAAKQTGSCQSLLNQAGSSGVGTVTAAGATGKVAGATSKGAAPGGLTHPAFLSGFGLSSAVQIGLYSVSALMTGLLMVLL